MDPQRILGIILVVVGAILLFVGINASDSVADKVSDTFTGKYTDSTMWYIVGGAAVALLGVVMMLFKVKQKA